MSAALVRLESEEAEPVTGSSTATHGLKAVLQHAATAPKPVIRLERAPVWEGYAPLET